MARRSALIRGILILALGFTVQVNAQCSRSIEAHDGDTCASLAALTGITVAQFLKSNPSVTSCSNLTPGRTYCVEGTAPAATGSATSPVQTSGPLQVSTDGTCGPGVTCKGSGFGSCCSKHGFCGSTADYCGDGCQPSLGTCGTDSGTPSSTITPPPAGTATKTVTVTSTATTTSTAIVSITRASIVLQTSTVVVTSAVISTSTRTAVVTATGTVTATVTSTVVRTSTATASAKVVTLTSIVFSTSTQYQTAVTTSTAVATRTAVATVTSTAKVTSVVVETLTTIKTVSVTACGGGGGLVTTIWQTQTNRPTPTIIIGTTRIPGGPSQPRPTPYLPGSSNKCRNYDQIQEGDTCRQIANRNSVSLLDFYKLNPSVSANKPLLGGLLCTLELLLSGLCQIDCDDLWPGYFVCVEEN
ncbi:hypothetical protein V8F33_005644 [Rhypophila sp. PSN 637]